MGTWESTHKLKDGTGVVIADYYSTPKELKDEYNRLTAIKPWGYHIFRDKYNNYYLTDLDRNILKGV